MRISTAGLDLITRHEGLRLKAYLPTPEDVPTIGYGHTKGVALGDICSADSAMAFLREDVQEAEDCINAHVQVELTQGQFDALCSLVFNIGCTAFKNSTILRLVNAEQFEAARLQFARWNKQAGKELAGLTKRREDEAETFAA